MTAQHVFPLVVALLALHSENRAKAAPPGVLVGPAAAEVDATPDSPQVTQQRTDVGVEVKVRAGPDGYPGVSFTRSDGKPFDLSAFGHVEAHVTNTGNAPLDLVLRLDNSGDWKDQPFNAENVMVRPGEKGVLHLIFGHSYGRKKGFALNPSAVTRLLVFTGKTEAEKSFRIDSIVAAGEAGELPPVDPETIRHQPRNGVIFPLPADSMPGPRLEAKDAAQPVLDPAKGIVARFPQSGSEALIKPEKGRWDLSQCLRVVVTLRNEGDKPVRPSLRLESNGGPTDPVQADELAPGASREIEIPFTASRPWRGKKDFNGKGFSGDEPGTGARLTSDAVSALVVSAGAADATLVVSAIRADVPPPPKLPEWLGKRPPVEGEWVSTFTDEFDGTAVDATRWNVHAANYWDKASWFSRDNVITGGGTTRLRYEKRSGHHNDDPAGKELGYATGVLDTYDKWTQLYGYFEVRVKLPTAPGLWPAFWLMPERGKDSGEQWQRQNTGDGAMEFDVVEHLTRWGPYRNNIAMHWDGYGEDHKQLGTDRIYMQPDKDGFITAGLLWLPGQTIYYINGSETARWENPRISKVPSCLLFTLPQGGWDNNAVDDSKLPADFVIDYVRIWQRKDLILLE
jgi:beta-glucanase (GH16 family)